MSVELLDFREEALPGGKVLRAEGDETLTLYVCRERRSYLQIPLSEKVIVTTEQETLVCLPVEQADIPALVSVVAARLHDRSPESVGDEAPSTSKPR